MKLIVSLYIWCLLEHSQKLKLKFYWHLIKTVVYDTMLLVKEEQYTDWMNDSTKPICSIHAPPPLLIPPSIYSSFNTSNSLKLTRNIQAPFICITKIISFHSENKGNYLPCRASVTKKSKHFFISFSWSSERRQLIAWYVFSFFSKSKTPIGKYLHMSHNLD